MKYNIWEGRVCFLFVLFTMVYLGLLSKKNRANAQWLFPVTLLHAQLLHKSSWFFILKVSGSQCPVTFLVFPFMIYGYKYYNSSLTDSFASRLFIYRITFFCLQLHNDSISLRWYISLFTMELLLTSVSFQALHFPGAPASIHIH